MAREEERKSQEYVTKARTEHFEKENMSIVLRKLNFKKILTKAMLLQALLSSALKNNTYATNLKE